MGWVASERFVVNWIQSCPITVTKEERKNSYTSHTSLQRNPVADPGEGPREPAPPPPPLIFRPNWGPKGRKNSFGDRAAPFLRVWMTGAPFISGSRSGTDLFPSCERIVILPILYVSTCSFVSFVSSLYLEFTVCLLHARDFNSVRDCTWCNRVLASPRVNENFQTKLSIYYKLATVLFGIRYTYWNLV